MCARPCSGPFILSGGHIRIPTIIPSKGRGLIHEGFTLGPEYSVRDIV